MYADVCPPEAICSNVQAGTILRDRGSSGKSLFSEGLQVWLHSDVMADFSEEVGGEVANFIMAQNGKSTFLTRETMVDSELGSALTVSGDVGGEPTISQGECIPEGTLV